MTETMATVTTHSGEDFLNRPESCGPAVATADLKIMDEAGTRELPVGEVGELWAKGPMIVNGYWNNPAATAATFVDGWVRTGRSEEHTSELQSLMRISYAVFCLNKQKYPRNSYISSIYRSYRACCLSSTTSYITPHY